MSGMNIPAPGHQDSVCVLHHPSLSDREMVSLRSREYRGGGNIRSVGRLKERSAAASGGY